MTNCLKTLFEKQRRETHIFNELSPDFLASHSLQGFGNKEKKGCEWVSALVSFNDALYA